MREERRPLLVEAITYRFRGHSMADPEEYRTKEEVAQWRERDPHPRVRRPAGERRRVDAEQREQIDERGDRAGGRGRGVRRGSPFPEPSALYDDVYVLDEQVQGHYHGRATAPAIPLSRGDQVMADDRLRYREALNQALREEMRRDEP